MITGELKDKVDRLWLEFWQGGISNPLTVIEQITFLMFARMLDINESRDEKRASRTKHEFTRRFNEGQQQLRWSQFCHEGDPDRLMELVRDGVFKHFREHTSDIRFGDYMKDARLAIDKPELLAKAVSMVTDLPLEAGDTKGDLYEYLLSKLTTAGINGQFRTPRHIIRLMVRLMDPEATDVIADPACGTAGFLVSALEYLQEKYTSAEGIIEEELEDELGAFTQRTYTADKLTPSEREHIETQMFHGFDFDSTMLRIASMNMYMHGARDPDIHYQDSLAQSFSDNFKDQEKNAFDIILANPPFKGSLDEDTINPPILRMVKTKKTELLFVAQILRMLKDGGRSATIVPQGVIESEGKAHSSIRRLLVDNNQLEAVICLPHWVFKPYASVATAILIFTKGGVTDDVWFYRVDDDGFTDGAKKEPTGTSELGDLADLYVRRHEKDYLPVRDKHRFVTRSEIIENNYDLCHRVYLRDYEYPQGLELKELGDLFSISKGGLGAASAVEGGYDFVTSSQSFKKAKSFSYDDEAIIIPLVSSTGHGHASINHIHYINGKFEAASITAVMTLKSEYRGVIDVKFYHAFLAIYKEVFLVPYMRGAANVSLNLDRLSRIKVPLIPVNKQAEYVSKIDDINVRVAELDEKKKELLASRDVVYQSIRGSF